MSKIKKKHPNWKIPLYTYKKNTNSQMGHKVLVKASKRPMKDKQPAKSGIMSQGIR